MFKAHEPPQDAERIAEEYFRTRDPRLRDSLIESKLYIAKMIARKFSGRGVDFDDLYQVASLALVKATERYNPAFGVKFAGFVTPSMVGEVKNYFRDHARAIRISRSGAERMALLEKTKETLTHTLMRSPTASELSEAAGLSLEEVLETMEMRGAMQPQSLDEPLPQEGDEAMSLGSLLSAEERGYSDFEDNDSIQRAMQVLSPREQSIIRMRFFQNLSQREAAQRLNISQMTVSRLERKALSVLREQFDGTGDSEV